MEHENDTELHHLLQEWKMPAGPPLGEPRVFKNRPRWWGILVHGYIRVPVPIACCIAAVMLAGAWRLVTVPATVCPTAIMALPTDPAKVPVRPAPAALLPCALKSTC